MVRNVLENKMFFAILPESSRVKVARAARRREDETLAFQRRCAQRAAKNFWKK